MRNAPSNTDNVIDSRDIIERIEELEGERLALIEALSDANGELEDTEAAYTKLREIPAAEDEDLADAQDELDEAEDAVDESLDKVKDAEKDLTDWDDENGSELTALKSLQDECEGYCDWRHGEALIADDYFETYAEQLAEDVCDMKSASQWPFTHIDWKAAAEALQQDYTQVDFDGETYWIRS